MDQPYHLVQMRGITKTYPGVRALQGVDFDLRPGETHCLVGENGAGKSTLMRILSGAERPDAGSIHVAGTTYEALDPALGHDLGISAIYQETDLVPQLSVAENIFLGHEPMRRRGLVNRAGLHRRSAEILARIGVRISPQTPVGALSAANKQFVQIAKALSRDSRVLIMDEPGAVLSDHELAHLFETVAQLKRGGMGIVFISHRLNEVLAIGDRVTVMRDGAAVRTDTAADLTIPEVVRSMVGRALGEQFAKTPNIRDEVVLSVRDLSVDGQFRDVDLDLRRGEILGIAGLVGAGRTELLHCLYGVTKPDRGTIVLDGERVRFRSPRQAVKLGLGLVPEERREEALVLPRSVNENIALSVLDKLARRLVLDARRMSREANGFVERLRIRTPTVEQQVRNLSGGNQQKVVLARWLAAGTKILLLDEPTRGVDVGAKAEIYQLMNQLAAQGISIVMVSSELPEVIGMSDRILVMAEGRITKEFAGGHVTQEAIMEHAIPEASRMARSA
jgi:ABC-type sugar transport system ATPase subunit